MKEITKLMIKKYALMKLKYDFMGYMFQRSNQLSYHHLIIPRRSGGPMTFENGVILRQNTSHDYLHIIERVDNDMFLAITSEMIDENLKGYLDWENIKAIDDILNQFEKEHCGDRTKKGKPLIKEEYVMRPLRGGNPYAKRKCH